MNSDFIVNNNIKNWKNLKELDYHYKVNDKVSKLYPVFEQYKQYFKECYDFKNMRWDDFNKFYLNTKYLNNEIMKFVSINIIEIDNDLITDWILTCFYKHNTNKKNVQKDGCVIELIKKNNFERYFCATLKNALCFLIKNKIKAANKQIKEVYYMGDENKMNDIQDLKDYIQDLNFIHGFEKFIHEYLTKTELKIFVLILNSLKRDNDINPQYIKKSLNLKDSAYKKHIMNIRNKYKEYKIKYYNK